MAVYSIYRDKPQHPVGKLRQMLALLLVLPALVGCTLSARPVAPTSTPIITANPPAPTTTSAPPVPTATHMLNLKLGVLGDSLSDEYRANDNRVSDSYGGRYADTTLNWLELLVTYRGLDAGKWGAWGEPRRNGYEYNWARSGATVHDVVSAGQLTGLEDQIRQGKITDVIVIVGANDFAIWNGTYAAMYYSPAEGGQTDDQVRQKVDDMMADYATIVDRIQAAGPVHLMVSNLQDRGMDPYFQAQFPDPSRRQRATDAVARINAGLQALSVSRGFYQIDRYHLGMDNVYVSQVDAQGYLHLNGELIDVVNADDEPHHGILADHEHVGTVGNGLMANLLFIKALNSFGAGITPFTEEEIIANAGITSTDTSGIAP